MSAIGQAGASPIMSPRTSCTVATEFSFCSTVTGSACCLGATGSGFCSIVTGSVCCLGATGSGFCSTVTGSVCCLSFEVLVQYLFYLNTQDQEL